MKYFNVKKRLAYIKHPFTHYLDIMKKTDLAKFALDF